MGPKTWPGHCDKEKKNALPLPEILAPPKHVRRHITFQKFYFGLFNDDIISKFRALNGTNNGEGRIETIRNKEIMAQMWYYPSICIVGLKETTRNSSQDGQCPH
jgi:hypothetical protein